ncbi:MAG: hypothetical protein LUD00_04100 [Prevotellaceae bacterium]|nr:hypothetical protein [Prevotellaceae bacterium]
MINDDFNFTLDNSDFPVSIEEFAAYLDGNLSDKEMERISSVVENDDVMQDVMDEMEQSELTFAEYGQEDVLLPEVLEEIDFFIPETDSIHVLVAEDYYDSNCLELPQIEEHIHPEEFEQGVYYNEINNIEETFDSDSNTDDSDSLDF